MNPDPNQPPTPPAPPIVPVENGSTPPVTTPPPPPPPGITSQPPKVKWGKGQLVGAIVVVVVLVAGLAAGLFLSQRQQNVVPNPAAVCAPNNTSEWYCQNGVNTCHACENNEWQPDGTGDCSSLMNVCNPCTQDTTCQTAPPATEPPPGQISCAINSQDSPNLSITVTNNTTADDAYQLHKCYCPGGELPCNVCDFSQNGVGAGLNATEVQSMPASCGSIQLDVQPLPGAGWSPCFATYTSGVACAAPTPTPTLAPNTPACVSSTISTSTLAPGQSATLTSTSNINADSFWYVLYNTDNLYPAPPAGNAKPICVTSGGDDPTPNAACPAGTHPLVYKDANTAPRTSGTRTLTYAQIFVADQNNGGAVATHVSINSYFGITGGGSSHADGNCVEFINAAGAPTPTPTAAPFPTNTPTRTPTPTPSRTPTPPPGATLTPTPTPPPGVAQCQQVTVASITRGGATVSSPTLAKIQKGDVVTFRGFATATNAQVTSIDFVLTKAGVAQATAHITPTLVGGVYQANYPVTIDQATSYSITSSPTYQ